MEHANNRRNWVWDCIIFAISLSIKNDSKNKVYFHNFLNIKIFNSREKNRNEEYLINYLVNDKKKK